MASLLFTARLVLAAVFLISGASKILDVSGFRRALSSFGIPRLVLMPAAIAVPLAELGIAAGLVEVSLAWSAAVAALCLLLLFTVAIAVNMALGRRPDCHCFGQLHSKPIGWSTLGRNFLLSVTAGFVVWKGRIDLPGSVFSWVASLTLGQRLVFLGLIPALFIIGIQSWLLIQTLAQHGRLLLRLDAIESKLGISGLLSAQYSYPAGSPDHGGLTVGQRAPDFSLKNLRGKTVTLASLLERGKTTLLVFTDPNCGACNALLPRIGRWQRELAASITLAVIGRLSVEANEPKAIEHHLTDVLLQVDREIAEAYMANAAPSMVLVRRDGTIGHTAIGPDAIEQMVANLGVTRSVPSFSLSPRGNVPQHKSPEMPIARSSAQVGDQAPPFELPNLEGKIVSLETLGGAEILVLFWNPSCEFCKRMLSDLKAWEADPPAGAPTLVVVSMGAVEVNRALGLASIVVLQSDFRLASEFGATGTPSAVLVNSQGTIASELVVGASEIFKLARRANVIERSN